MSKKKLKARIVELEREVAQLKLNLILAKAAQQPSVAPTTEPWSPVPHIPISPWIYERPVTAPVPQWNKWIIICDDSTMQ